MKSKRPGSDTRPSANNISTDDVTTAPQVKRCPCGRPARAKGLCQAHYKAAQRDGTNRRSASSPVSGTRPPKNRTPDQDFVRSFSHLSQTEKVVWENGVLRKGDEFQMVGVVCPDCRGEIVGTAGGYPVRDKPGIGRWCASERHPLFDVTGRLVQAMVVPR